MSTLFGLSRLIDYLLHCQINILVFRWVSSVKINVEVLLCVLLIGCTSSKKQNQPILLTSDYVYDTQICTLGIYDYKSCMAKVMSNSKKETARRSHNLRGIMTAYQVSSSPKIKELFYTIPPQVNQFGKLTPYGRFTFIGESRIRVKSLKTLIFSHPSYTYALMWTPGSDFNIKEMRKGDYLSKYLLCGALVNELVNKAGITIYQVTRINCSR